MDRPKDQLLPPAAGRRRYLDSGCSFLFGSGANASLPTVIRNEELPALFPVLEASGSGWSFDLFAMVFFMLSRYEEYLISERDEHGRFPPPPVWPAGGFLKLHLWTSG
ncbi:MAG: hypothetical protein IPH04_09570 [Saprospirales bacterium]|nr:hypothetical protein [Saprospirales bacterium]